MYVLPLDITSGIWEYRNMNLWSCLMFFNWIQFFWCLVTVYRILKIRRALSFLMVLSSNLVGLPLYLRIDIPFIRIMLTYPCGTVKDDMSLLNGQSCLILQDWVGLCMRVSSVPNSTSWMVTLIYSMPCKVKIFSYRIIREVCTHGNFPRAKQSSHFSASTARCRSSGTHNTWPSPCLLLSRRNLVVGSYIPLQMESSSFTIL